MSNGTRPKIAIGSIVDILLPLLLVGLLIALCIQLLFPFVGVIIWTIILTICFHPLHKRLTRRGMSNALSATVIGTALAALVLAPTAIAAVSAASSIPDMVSAIHSGEQQVPPPPPRLREVPIVGERAYGVWTQATTDLPAVTQTYRPQISKFLKSLLGFAAGLFVGVLLLVLAIIFAAISLAYSERLRAFVSSIFARITGNRQAGEHYMDIVGATVRSVANGVIGVAFVQALLVGVGFFAIGVPGAGLLSLVAMVFGVLQVPVILITLPAILYAFSVETTTVAIIFTIWSIIAGLSDAVLKPLMIGHGLEVPMPIILLGVIGGVMAFGLVGLFIGAVLLAVGYVLFIEWVGGSTAAKDAAAPSPPDNVALSAAE